ncbi:MAG TPA: hypothetical protein VGT40_23860 [Methylomirabilota bacterium]|jgi:hypothetical protein|nr:hypothetical protein [Methylomirabilota bacterium]
MSILVFVVVAILASALCHYIAKSYIIAAIASAFVTAISFHIIAYLVQGYLDPLAIVSLITTWLIGFVISLLIGLPVMFERRRGHR